jgi:hypothetical protein
MSFVGMELASPHGGLLIAGLALPWNAIHAGEGAELTRRRFGRYL